jgi:hypothetical protein
MDRQSGQATVEWVALILMAALILGAAAAHSATRDDRGLGRLMAERIASAPSRITSAPERSAGAPQAPTPGRDAARAPAAAGPPVRSRSVDADAGMRRVVGLAQKAWIVCLGYRRLSHDLEHPRAPNEAISLSGALNIVNSCLNPYAFLLGGN